MSTISLQTLEMSQQLKFSKRLHEQIMHYAATGGTHYSLQLLYHKVRNGVERFVIEDYKS
jgi:hypothetical protein